MVGRASIVGKIALGITITTVKWYAQTRLNAVTAVRSREALPFPAVATPNFTEDLA